jgi:hypothetical protein
MDGMYHPVDADDLDAAHLAFLKTDKDLCTAGREERPQLQVDSQLRYLSLLERGGTLQPSHHGLDVDYAGFRGALVLATHAPFKVDTPAKLEIVIA